MAQVAKVTVELVGQEPKTELVYELDEFVPMFRRCSDGKEVVVIMGTCKDKLDGEEISKKCPKTTVEVMGEILEVTGSDLV